MVTSTKILILGSGPAGETAGIYAARADMGPILLTGMQEGGQLTITTEVENYPGFPTGIMGPQLMADMKQQAEKFGVVHKMEMAVKVDLSQRPFPVWTRKDGDPTYLAEVLIIATGAEARWLNLPSIDKLRNKGISACATCDGFFFKDRDICVVGGGDSAMEEAHFLARFGSRVRVIHRRDELRATKILQEKAFAEDKMDFLWNAQVSEIVGGATGVESLNISYNDGSTSSLPVTGIFILIGVVPNNEVLPLDQLETDSGGFIVTDSEMCTKLPGVFAAGDISSKNFRQIVNAAGEGATAELSTEHYLGNLV